MAISKLIKITVENAGAVTGILMLYKEGSLYIEAEYNINTQSLNILESIPVEKSKKLPLSILHYVEAKKDLLIIRDASNEKKFSRSQVKNRKKLFEV